MATYSYTVTASGNDHYLWSGHGLVDAPDPHLFFRAGDIVNITNASGGHPMRITNNAAPSVDPINESNGAINVNPVLEGAFTYVCTSHAAMTGQIAVSAAYANEGPEDGYGTGPLIGHDDGPLSMNEIRTKINEIITKGGIGGGSINVNESPPSGAKEGDLWYDTDVALLYVYIGDPTNAWIQIGGGSGSGSSAIQTNGGGGSGGGASVTTDPTAPSNPSDGDLWFNENEAELYVYTASLGAWIQTNGGGGGDGTPNWSTGWVNTDGTTSVANQATLQFTHNLGTDEFVQSVWVADDASGTNTQEIRTFANPNGGAVYGAVITDKSTTTVTLQLLYDGWMHINSSGDELVQNWSGKYVKVVLMGVGGSGGGVSTGIQRTQWEYQAVEGLNWINSLSLKGEPAELWKNSPLPRYHTGLPNAWIFSAMRCLNGSTVHSFEVYRDGDLVKFFGANSSECHGATGVIVSDPAAYNNGGYILAQTSKYGNLTGVTSRSSGQGYGIDGNLMGYIQPNVTSDVIINSANIGTSWVTMNTGKPNSLVYLLVEPIAGQANLDVKIKQKGDSGIESVPRASTWGGGGCSTLVVSGTSNTSGVPYWRGGYSFCMTDSNGDLEVLTGRASAGAKVTMIGSVTADLTKADVEINNGAFTLSLDDFNAVVTPSDGTTISTGLSGYNLVFLKTIGTNNNNVYYRTPGDTLKPYQGVSYSGYGCNGGCLNTNLGTYAVAMTDINGDLKGFTTSSGSVKTIIKGSVPITLA